MATVSRRRATVEILQRRWRVDRDDVTLSGDGGNPPATAARRWRRCHAVERRWRVDGDDVTPSGDGGNPPATTARRWRRRHAVGRRTSPSSPGGRGAGTFWICDFGFWIGRRGVALLFSLFSRRKGGRLGEEGRGDEGSHDARRRSSDKGNLREGEKNGERDGHAP